MKQFVKNGITTTMTYDADGLRSSKTVGGVKTEYQYVGDKLFYENRGNGDSFYYYYDSYGNLCAFYHHRNGTKTAYHVVTNSQGDVIAIYNWSGSTKVAEYKYDAWGNCTIVSDTSSTGIATLNPIRYRGYYYDNDLGLYYLQSRYYDSEIGRFVNADGYISTGQGVTSYNMFAYCNNNPVMYSDPSGKFLISVLIVITGVSIYHACKGDYVKSKTGETVCNITAQTAKSPAISKTANIGGSVISIVSMGVSLYKAVDSKNQKMKLIEQLTKDCYNAAYYANNNASYSVEYTNYDAFTNEQYNKIIQDSIGLYTNEIIAYQGVYSDLGNYEWDSLSSHTQDFMKGRFADVNPKAYVSLTAYYMENGAVIP